MRYLHGCGGYVPAADASAQRKAPRVYNPAAMKNAAELIERLGLQPHPEGGWFREVHRAAARVGTERGSRSA